MDRFMGMRGLRAVIELGFDRLAVLLLVAAALILSSWLGLWLERLMLGPLPGGFGY